MTWDQLVTTSGTYHADGTITNMPGNTVTAHTITYQPAVTENDPWRRAYIRKCELCGSMHDGIASNVFCGECLRKLRDIIQTII